jgi:hypothetical protein
VLILPIVVSISLFVIADIDSPRGGVILVQPQNLVSLAQFLQAHYTLNPCNFGLPCEQSATSENYLLTLANTRSPGTLVVVPPVPPSPVTALPTLEW